jgi:hypothetical protein
MNEHTKPRRRSRQCREATVRALTVRIVWRRIGDLKQFPDAFRRPTSRLDRGVPAEKDSTASYSTGIEVWLPTQVNWNERIRNYCGGGWVGGGHRFADKIGSKVPAIVNANMGYASGTTDAGQPWYQDGSLAFLSDGGGQHRSVS